MVGSETEDASVTSPECVPAAKSLQKLPDALFKTPYFFEEDLQELSLGKATLVPPNPISLFFVTACFVVVTLPACVAVAVFWWCWQRRVPLRVRH